MKNFINFLSLIALLNFSIFRASAQSCTGSLGDPVVNMTFGTGSNPGAVLPTGQTNYINIADCPNDGYYSIRTNIAGTCYNGWQTLTSDHTGDLNGYMMIVNASYSPGEFFNTTVSGLCGGTTYEFSSWIINILKTGTCTTNAQRFPVVTFSIETPSGTVLKTFSTGNVPETTSPQWNRYATYFTTPTGISTVVLRLVNNAPGGCGNDLALDDIQFRACGPTLTASISSASICVGTTTTLSATISSGYNSPVFQWQESTDSGTTWNNISGATNQTYALTKPIGTYQYRVLASESGNIGLVKCRIASNVLSLTVNPFPNLTATATSLCAGQCVDLKTLWTDQNATTSPTTGTIGYFNTLSDAQNNANALASSLVCPAVSRSYWVSKTLNGCQNIVEIPITVKPLPVASASTSTPTICAGNTINLAAGTVANATYAWAGPNSFSSTSQNPNIAAATTAAGGIYTLTVTLNGCTATATTTVLVNPLPTASANNNSPICQGQTLNLTGGTNGTSYVWAGPNSFVSVTQSPSISNVTTSASGTYTITATLNGCTSTATTNVIINPLPVPTIGSNSPICAGNTLNLTSSGGTNYAWTSSTGFTSSLQNPTISNATVAQSGTYTITVKDANGCSATASTAVTVNPLPTASAASNSPVCQGSALNLTGGTNGTSYVWAGPNSFVSAVQNPVISNVTTSASGTYTITATLNGCTSTATTAVTIKALPNTTASNNSPICQGATLNLIALNGLTGTNNKWTGPNNFSSTQQNPSILAATTAATGTYSLTVTINGCSLTSTTIATVNPLPIPTIGSNAPICVGKTLNLTSSGGANYAWTSSTGFTSSSQNPSIPNVTTSQSGTYTVAVTDLNGCVATAATTVLVNPLPIPTIGSNSPICVGKTLNLTSSGGANYAWTSSTGFTSSSQNPSIPNVTTSQSGTYTVTVTDLNGCVATAATTVLVNPLPIPTIGSNAPICVGKTLNLTSSGGANYAWTSSTGFTSSSQNPSIPNVTTSQSGTYTVAVTDLNGCVATAATTVLVNPLPIPTIGSNAPICVGKTLNLTSSGGANYAWTSSTAFTSSSQNPSIPNVTTSQSGTYTVAVTDLNGCVATAATTVLVNPLPIPTIGSNSPICAGKTLNLTSSGGANYAWTSSTGFTSSSQNPSIPNVTTSQSGTYTVAVTDLNGCVATVATTVLVNPLPIPTIGSNAPICAGKTLNLTASGGTNYAWTSSTGFTSSSQNPSIPNVTTSQSGTYTVAVTDLNGCVATAATTVLVNLLPIPTIGSNAPICVGKTLNLTASGGANYAWTSSTGFTSSSQNPSIPNVTTSQSGTYTVTVTDLNGCVATTSMTVLVNPLPTLQIGTVACTPNLKFYTVNFSSTGGAVSTTAGNLTNIGADNYVISGISAGINITITVTSAENCSITQDVNAPDCSCPAVSPPVNNGDKVICEGQTTPNLTANVGANETVDWYSTSNGGSALVSGTTSFMPTNTIAGIYTYYAETRNTVNDCISSTRTPIVLTIKSTPAAKANNNSPICEATQLDLTGSSNLGGVSYSWSGPNGYVSGSQNPSILNVTPSQSGTYTLTVTLNGCSTQDSTAVIIKPKPQPIASNDGAVCEGFSLNLSTNSITNASYDWSGPSNFTSNLQNPLLTNVTPSNSGIYTVTVTLNGCENTATTQVTVNPKPSITAGTPQCSTDLATYSVGFTASGGVVSTSSGTISGNIVSGIAASDDVKLIVTSAEGCKDSVLVKHPDCLCPPTNAPLSDGDKTICQNEIIPTLSAQVGANETIDWYDAPTGGNKIATNSLTFTPTQTSPNTYIFYAETRRSDITIRTCISSTRTAIKLLIKPLPQAIANSNSAICEGDSLKLTAASVSGATFSWAGVAGFTSTDQNPILTNVTPSQSGTYTVSVTLNGCVSSDQTSVLIKPLPVSIATSNAINGICEGINLHLEMSGTNTIDSYNWTGPNNFSQQGQVIDLPNASPSQSGTYFLTTSLNGCTATSSVAVTIKPLPVAIANNTGPVCAGDSVVLSAADVPDAIFEWFDPNGNSIGTSKNMTLNNVTPSQSGTYEVKVTVNGCSKTDTTIVLVKPNPIAIGTGSTVCEGQTITLSAQRAANASYQWTGINGFIALAKDTTIANASPNQSGIYTLKVTSNGCSSQDTAMVLVKPLPIINPLSNSPICESDTIKLTTTDAGTGAIYAWVGPNNFTSNFQNPTISNAVLASAGIYKLTVNLDGCSRQDSVFFTVKPKPIVKIMGSETLCEGDSLKLSTQNVGATATYNWLGVNNFSASSQNITISNVTPSLSGNYKVNVSLNGCFLADSVNVIINPLPILTIDSVKCTPDLKQYSIYFKVQGGVVTTSAGIVGNGIITAIPIDSVKVNLAVNSPQNCLISQIINAPNCQCSVIQAPVSQGDTAICEGQKNPNLQVSVGKNQTADWYLNANGGTKIFTGISFTPSKTDTFFVEARDTISQCVSATRTIVRFVIKQNPMAKISTNSPICEGDTLKLTAENAGTSASYEWSKANLNISSSENVNLSLAKPADSGKYFLKVASNGCFSIDSVDVLVKPKPVFKIVANHFICEGDTLKLASDSLNSQYFYAWQGVSGFTNNQGKVNIFNVTPSLSGFYKLKITSNGCFQEDSVNILVNPLPTLNVDSVKCSPDLKTFQIYFHANGNLTASAGNIATNIVQNIPIDSAKVSLTVSSAAGCKIFQIVNAPNCNCAVILPPIGKDSAICAGQNLPILQVSVGKNQTADWYNSPSGGTKIFSGLAFLPTKADTFFVEARDTITNCLSATRTAIRLIINELPSLNIDSVKCSPDLKTFQIYFHANGNLTASAGNIATNIVQNIPIDSAKVSLTVSSSAGCKIFQIVNAPNCNCAVILPPIGKDSAICAGQNLPILQVSVGKNQTADWYNSPSGGTKIFSGLAFLPTKADTFFVEARDTITNCLSATRTAIHLIINELPTLNIDSVKCSPDLKTFQIYFHANGNLTASAGNIATNIVQNIPIDSAKVSLTVSSSAGCKIFQIVNAPNCNCAVILPPIGKDSAICAGQNLPILQVSVGKNQTADWYNSPSGGTKIFSGLAFLPTKADTFFVETRDTITNCLSATRTAIHLIINELPTLNIDSVKCAADLKTFQIYFHANGNLTASAGNIATNIVQNIPIDSSKVSLVVTSAAGCKISQIINAPNCHCAVILPPIGKDSAICAGQNLPILQVSVGKNQTADWYNSPSGGSKIFSGLAFLPTKADTFFVETRDTITNCLSTTRTAIRLIINELPSFYLIATPSVCIGGLVQNNGKIKITNLQNGDFYDYAVGNIFLKNTPTLTPIPADGLLVHDIANPTANSQTFTVRVFNKNGCFLDKSIQLLRRDCACPPTICVPFVVQKTKSHP